MKQAIEGDLKRVQEIINEESRIKGLERISSDESLVYGSGKMIRPTLVVLSGRLHGCADDLLPRYAAAVEMLHNSTLHHDDIIDSGLVRRGVPTINARYDDDVALLTGDFLVARCFGLLASGGNAKVVATMSDCYEKLVYGQLREMELDNRSDAMEKDYYDVIDNKTASLIAASLIVGAQAAGASGESIRNLESIGLIAGRLFQIADDMLDLLGEEEETGKARFKDIREGKMTLPMIRLLNRCDAEDRKKISGALGNTDLNRDGGLAVVEMMEKYSVLKDIHNEGHVFQIVILEKTAALPQNEYTVALRELLEGICRRMFQQTQQFA